VDLERRIRLLHTHAVLPLEERREVALGAAFVRDALDEVLAGFRCGGKGVTAPSDLVSDAVRIFPAFDWVGAGRSMREHLPESDQVANSGEPTARCPRGTTARVRPLGAPWR